ncbi:class I SAM-dependent methyltransferase, partial [Ectothiorhodospira haloalkaliphila]
MNINFTAHNIRLDDGSFTKPEANFAIDSDPRLIAAGRILETAFPGKKDHLRIADVGCLEGGYAVEFARMGFQVLGIEVRQSNIDACNYVKSKVNLPNLMFVKNNAWNIAEYGEFDAIFCCGLLYHIDNPRQYLKL